MKEKLEKKGDPYDFQIIKVAPYEIKNYDSLSKEQKPKAIADEENKRLLNRINNLYNEGRKIRKFFVIILDFLPRKLEL